MNTRWAALSLVFVMGGCSTTPPIQEYTVARTALEAEHDLTKLGLVLDNLKIQTVADEKGYLDLFERIGAEIIAHVSAHCFSALHRAPVRVGAPAIPIPWASGLRDATLPTVDRILRAVREVLT